MTEPGALDANLSAVGLDPLVWDRGRLARYAWLSIATSCVVIGLKAWSATVTGSVGLLSDVLESAVNLVAACFALLALRAAARPPDERYPFGRDKAEYLSAGAEGAMVLIAAFVIGVAAIGRLFDPRPIERLGVGVLIIVAATVLNAVVGVVLTRVGRAHRSITLEADGTHLLTDVWTSIGVVVGVSLSVATGWLWLDPVVAVLVAVNILITGTRLIRRSGWGLLDAALPVSERASIDRALETYRAEGVQFHALRSRSSGEKRFVYMHVLVPGDWTVQRAHDLLEEVEHDIAQALPGTTTFTHLEPVEDERSFADQDLGDARFRK